MTKLKKSRKRKMICKMTEKIEEIKKLFKKAKEDTRLILCFKDFKKDDDCYLAKLWEVQRIFMRDLERILDDKTDATIKKTRQRNFRE